MRIRDLFNANYSFIINSKIIALCGYNKFSGVEIHIYKHKYPPTGEWREDVLKLAYTRTHLNPG